MRHISAMPLVATLALLFLGACTSSPKKYHAASEEMSEQLIDQLEKRTDPRHVRVLVYEFTPCEIPENNHLRRPAHSEAHFARQIKHQIMSVLARRVIVIEGPEHRAGRYLPPIEESERGLQFEEAKKLGATAVLVGNYSVTGKRQILLMARLVDTESNQVLATAEETLRSVDVPHAHK